MTISYDYQVAGFDIVADRDLCRDGCIGVVIGAPACCTAGEHDGMDRLLIASASQSMRVVGRDDFGSSGVLIPTLAVGQQSMVVLDPTGNLYRATALRRARMGHNVWLFDPTGIVRGDWKPEHILEHAGIALEDDPTAGAIRRLRFDPIQLLDPTQPSFRTEVRRIAEMIVEPEELYARQQTNLVEGLVLHLFEEHARQLFDPHRFDSEKSTEPSLDALYRVLTSSDDQLLATIGAASDAGGPAGELLAIVHQQIVDHQANLQMRRDFGEINLCDEDLLQEKAGIIDDYRPDIASRYRGHRIRTMNCDDGSDSDFADIARRPTTTFIVMPDELADFARFIIASILGSVRKARNDDVGRSPRHVTFLLDDVAPSWWPEGFSQEVLESEYRINVVMALQSETQSYSIEFRRALLIQEACSLSARSYVWSQAIKEIMRHTPPPAGTQLIKQAGAVYLARHAHVLQQPLIAALVQCTSHSQPRATRP